MAQKLMYIWQMKLTRHKLIGAVLFFAALFYSCKNDLKLNAPYKELPSIYAVISPQDKIKIIRINKVFLGEGDANKMAKVSDSINYQPGDLTVTLSRFVDGTQVDACPTCPSSSADRHVITFRDSVIQALPGAFSTEQRVYVSSADLHQGLPTPDHNMLNTNPNWKVSGDYVLTVKNNKTGNIFTAKATAVDSVSGSQGLQPFSPIYYPYPAGTLPSNSSYIDYSEPNKTYNIYYIPKDGTGTIYQLVVRLHFYDVLFNGDKVYRYIDYPLSNQFPQDAQSLGGALYLNAYFKGIDLFNAAANSLAQMNLSDQVLGRKMYKIQYFVYSSTDEYNDYLQFAAPSLDISQNKPLYSNFDNQAALGIFTFRARCSVVKEMSTSFISSFQTSSLTCSYLFYNNDESRHGCQ
jgi:hypothetical protein